MTDDPTRSPQSCCPLRALIRRISTHDPAASRLSSARLAGPLARNARRCRHCPCCARSNLASISHLASQPVRPRDSNSPGLLAPARSFPSAAPTSTAALSRLDGGRAACHSQNHRRSAPSLGGAAARRALGRAPCQARAVARALSAAAVPSLAFIACIAFGCGHTAHAQTGAAV